MTEKEHEEKKIEKENRKKEDDEVITIDLKKLPKTPWFYSTVIISAVLTIVLIGTFQGWFVKVDSKAITTAEVAEKVSTYLQKAVSGDVQIIGVEKMPEQDLFVVGINISGSVYTSFVTSDGNVLFPSAVNLNAQITETADTQTPTVEKTEKPKAEAFIMSYCPYGLQFLKAYIPVLELLKDKADLTVNFVSYAMHGKKELDENLRMYCIQKEQKAKFIDYLTCFVKAGDYAGCITEVKIDSEMLDKCTSETDVEYNITEMYNDKETWMGGSYPQFNVESDLNIEYGVKGSPTLVLNGVQISPSRTAEAIKTVVCNAFITAPEECKTTLSTQAESAGLGPIGTATGSTTEANCG